jgi:tyrosine-protein phosphatase SIW14
VEVVGNCYHALPPTSSLCPKLQNPLPIFYLPAVLYIMVNTITPPDVFGIIEPQLYRSSAPDPHSYSFLRTLNLKTILLLSPESPPRSLTNFLEESGIKLVHMGMAGGGSLTSTGSHNHHGGTGSSSGGGGLVGGGGAWWIKNHQSFGWKPVSDELIKEGLQFVLNRDNLPCMVMCT